MDKNYPPLDFANVHGTPEEPITVRVDATVPGLFTITGHPNPAFNGTFNQPTPGDGHSDTIKMSNCCWLRVVVTGRLIGGAEDCFDANNRTHDVEVYADEWESGGQYLCSIKGESKNVRVSGLVVKHGGTVDVDLGNWSDQSFERTTGVSIYFHTNDGSAVKVRVLNAWEPYLENGQNQRYEVNDFWKGLFQWVFFLLKKLHLVS